MTHIDYKLALELKEAGFDQPKEGKFYTEDGVVIIAYPEHDKEKLVYIPTLSKLIDACLELGEAMQLNIDKSGCGAWMGSKHTRETFQEGKSPKTAVAKLWLKLNGKKT